MGIVLLLSGSDSFEFKHRLDDRCLKGICEIDFTLNDDHDGDFYFYIGYKDFYLNHRKVILSVDYN